MFAIVGAYAIGGWAAAGAVCYRWLRNERTTVPQFLTWAGWAAVGVILAAIGAAL